MRYQFAVQRQNYEDYASGRVLYGRPGFPAFPVRLAGELFQRCCDHLARRGKQPPYTLYDPCCGGGYLLAVVGLLMENVYRRSWPRISTPRQWLWHDANLSLLSPAGLRHRLEEIQSLIGEYRQTLASRGAGSGERLAARLPPSGQSVRTECFQYDALGDEAWPDQVSGIDIVLADLPYGWTSSWKGATSADTASHRLLGRLDAVLAPTSVAVVVANREQAVAHPEYRRLEQMKAGKRRITVLTPGEPSEG